MDDPWGGLGVAYRRSVGMRGSPCAVRLAHLSGYQIRPTHGEGCAIGDELFVDSSVFDDPRSMHGDIATTLASILLGLEGYETTDEAIDVVARELLIDDEQLISDMIECGCDLEEIEQRHPRVPRPWLADAVDRLELPPENVVPLRRVARCGR